MADYPTSLPVGEDYDEQPRDGRVMDIGADGFSRIRKMHDDRIGGVTLTHKALNVAQVAVLEAHYAANLTSSFSWVSSRDGATYTMAYAGRPTYKLHLPQGILKTATVRLTQTA